MKVKESFLYKLFRPILSFLFKILYRPIIINKSNIPNTGRIILAGNHTSNLDCILLMSTTKRCIHYLAKDELWKGPKKIIFSNLGLIPVNRRVKDSNCLKLAKQYLEGGFLIGIFPEGTFSKVKEVLLPFKIGTVKLAYDTNTKIVPFSIIGEYKLFKKSVKIVFSSPIDIKDNNLDCENLKLKDIIEKQIKGDK